MPSRPIICGTERLLACGAMTTPAEPLAVSFDDVVAAAERIRGLAHRTPVVTLAHPGRAPFRAAFLEVRKPPTRRRLQVSRGLQRGGPPLLRGEGPRGAGLFLGQPCPGHCPREPTRRRPVHHRDAAGRPSRQAAGHRGLRRSRRGLRPADRPSRRDCPSDPGRERPGPHPPLRPPRRHRGPGHRGPRAHRGRGSSRPPPRSVRRRRAALGLGSRGPAPQSPLPGRRRGARAGRRCHAFVQDRDPEPRSRTRPRSPTGPARPRSASSPSPSCASSSTTW